MKSLLCFESLVTLDQSTPRHILEYLNHSNTVVIT